MSGPYILAAVIAFVVAAMYWNDEFHSFRDCLVAAAITAAIVFWPVGWVFEKMDQSIDEGHAQAAASSASWLKGMESRGCKRTSFVGTKSSITAVWTCPDGTATLDLR